MNEEQSSQLAAHHSKNNQSLQQARSLAGGLKRGEDIQTSPQRISKSRSTPTHKSGHPRRDDVEVPLRSSPQPIKLSSESKLPSADPDHTRDLILKR